MKNISAKSLLFKLGVGDKVDTNQTKLFDAILCTCMTLLTVNNGKHISVKVPEELGEIKSFSGTIVTPSMIVMYYPYEAVYQDVKIDGLLLIDHSEGSGYIVFLVSCNLVYEVRYMLSEYDLMLLLIQPNKQRALSSYLDVVLENTRIDEYEILDKPYEWSIIKAGVVTDPNDALERVGINPPLILDMTDGKVN